MLENLARASVFTLTATLGSGIGLAALPAPSHAQPPPPPVAAPLKVGFVYVSPIGEAGWTFQHEQGRLAMQRALGPAVVSTAVEGVAEGADSERVIRDLVGQGNRLIFATSFGYLEPVLRVAADHPEVLFEHAGGYKNAANVATYNARYYEARWLAGWLAGRSSRSGVAGYVAGFPVPEVVQGINAFALGMLEANPNAQVRVLWLNSWFDPAREREAAQTLVDRGADVLTNHSASPAVPQVAQANFKAKGVRAVGYQSDMQRFAPEAQLAAVTHHWGDFYTRVARETLAGRWSNAPVWAGMKDGLVQLGALAADVPPAVRGELDAKRSAIVDGRFAPFAAPLVDNEGRTRLAQGRLDDPAIASMNWFVKGVIGAVPKP